MGQGSSHQHKEGASRGETSEEAKSQHLKWLKTRFEELRDVSAGLSAETFDKLLAFPGADSIGYRWIAKHPDLKDVPALTFDNFVTIVSDSTHQTSAEFMFMLFSKDDSVLSREDALHMFNTGRVLGLAAGYHDRHAIAPELEDKRVAEWLTAGLFSSPDAASINKDDFIRWIQRNTPRVFDGVFRWIEIQVTTPAELHLRDKQMDLADIVISLEGEDMSGSLMSPSLAWLLSCSFPATYNSYGAWRLLYGSHLHGQSGNRFQHHTYRYSGPSITVVRAADGSVFAVAVDDEWRERACVWGGDACRLMRAAPSVAMSADTIKVYDDLRTRHKEHGFGFGRNPSQQDTALLWLDSSFSSATTTFCEGAADTHQTLNIDRIEVWGCGGDDALSQQDRQRKRDQLAAEQRQRAKRPGAEDWSDSVDRQLLSMAGVLTLDEQAREDVGHMRAEHKDKHHSSSSAN